MKQSKLFTKTRKEAPSDETSKNAQLLIRAGYIHKVFAGGYTFLPLAVKVLENIAEIIRQEMNTIGGQETQSTALQAKEPWQTTNRWGDDVVDNAKGAKRDDLPETGTNPGRADNPDGQRNSVECDFVPHTVLAAPRSVVGGGSTTSSLQLGSVAGDGATVVSTVRFPKVAVEVGKRETWTLKSAKNMEK